MSDYRSKYFALFNSITDAIETLKKAQQDAEERYLSEDGEPDEDE